MASKNVLSFSRPFDDVLVIHLAGNWKLANKLPDTREIQKQLESGPKVRRTTFDTQELTGWDSSLLTFLMKYSKLCARNTISIDNAGLPQGIRRLLALATTVPERKGARRKVQRISFFVTVGEFAIAFCHSTVEMLAFIGEIAVAFVRMFTGRARFRPFDLFITIQECGEQALPIVSLVSVLVGLILAFVGAIQLKMFGAQVYVADIVGIAMVRVMGAVMTGIIMAGRTGAAFAAQLGTMETNEETDALRTLGISPVEFLVLPRMLALMLMMPLLAIYADFMGIFGGFIVGVGMLDITPMQYYNQTRSAVNLTYFWVGLFHGAVFGVIVAISGCFRGMQCGRSASAVGNAATSAVVTGIVGIIVATAVITLVCQVLGI